MSTLRTRSSSAPRCDGSIRGAGSKAKLTAAGLPKDHLARLQAGSNALRDAIEGTKEFVGSQGVFNMSPADHNGVDQRSQVMVRIEGGTWKLQH